MTVKSTWPAVMSVPVSTIVFGVVNEIPPTSSSTVSPATAPATTSPPTLIVVAVPASTALRKLSASFVEPCSAGAAAAVGAATSFVKANTVLSGPVEFLSVSRAESDLAPSTPRSAPATVKST